MVTSRVSMAVARTIVVKMEEHVHKAAKPTKLQEKERLVCIQSLMTAINLSKCSATLTLNPGLRGT